MKFLNYKVQSVLLFAIMFIPVIISCSKDNENEPDGPEGNDIESPIDNLPEETQNFIGYWRGNPDFIFYEDGTCWKANEDGISSSQTGYWSYDPETKILSTTTTGYAGVAYNFQITLSNEYSWSGLWLRREQTSKTYSKATDYALAGLMLGQLGWFVNSDNDSLHFDAYGFYVKSYKNYYDRRTVYSDDEDKYDNTFKFRVDLRRTNNRFSDFHPADSGIIKIENLYYPGHVSLKISSTIVNGIFKTE